MALSSSPVAPADTLPPVPRTTIAGTTHTIVVLAIIIAWAAVGYFSYQNFRLAAHPPRIRRYIFLMLWEWCVVAYIAWGVSRGGGSLKALIGGKWKTAKDVFKDIAVSAGFWILAVVVLFATALAIHAPRAVESVRALLPQTRLEAVLWILTSITAGICEEIIFRGYLQRQFCAWAGSIPAGVLLSAVVFGAGHIYQGGKPAVVIAVYGVLFGILAETRKSLRPGMMVHAWHDAIIGVLAHLFRA